MQALFEFSVPPLELFARVSLVYWFLLLVLRFIMRRDISAVSPPDVLLIVLIADGAQNAMAGGYDSVAEGLVVVSTLLGWNWLLAWASFHFPIVARFTDPPPLLLIRDGKVLRRNLQKEHLTFDELKSNLREKGIEAIDEVRRAYMESDGTFSVLRKDGREASDDKKSKVPGAA